MTVLSTSWPRRPTNRTTYTPLLNTKYHEIQGQLSRDGKLLAYASDDTGPFQVYIKALPVGNRFQVSTSAGLDPHWGASDGEFFYINLQTHRLNAVTVKRAGRQTISAVNGLCSRSAT